jgi:DNA replication protein DnaC
MDIFRDTYSERVFSRISSSYRMRKLIGDDIRIKKKLAGYESSDRIPQKP